ncbi:hypothetical protein KGF57_000819 [Candida theae]|uniref:Uncharacterized protein n=1 Tax=Candida theae TaxID=1198502 RepID=A0AAD5G0E0_9ASCO|nr:uncharacterized protein KGF57_000819 [Candida theae]KAI5965026.1 hypothetical protein KGF57_000819 [Candida theae]
MITRLTNSFKPLLKATSTTLASSTASVGSNGSRISPSLTMYHNNTSILSHNLLKQLTSYSILPCTQDKIYQQGGHGGSNKTGKGIKSFNSKGSGGNKLSEANQKFYLDVKENMGLTRDDHKFIIEQCLDIHPDNTRVIIQSVSNVDFKKLSKQDKFDIVEQLQDYDKFLSTLTNNQDVEASSQGVLRAMPLIIDYKHKLLANDDVSFNRIMANYLSCGIQSVARSGNNLSSNVGDGERNVSSYTSRGSPGVVA